MIFDGIKFRRSRRVVAIPTRDESGALQPYVQPHQSNCVHFGRAVKEGSPIPKKAVKTSYRWDTPGFTPVWAVPIPTTGYSLTNMAYGDDGHIYLMHKGSFYIARK
jgi:hypothetical protein